MLTNREAVSLNSNPPLGRVSTIPKATASNVVFTVILDLKEDEENPGGAKKPWIVELWFGAKSQQKWQAHEFSCVKDAELKDSLVKSLTSPRPSTNRYVYTLTFKATPSSRPIAFTLRVRPTVQSSWIWARELTGLRDGHLLIKDEDDIGKPSTISDLFTNTDPKLEYTKLPSGPWETTLAVSGKVPPGETRIVLGKPKEIYSYCGLIKHGYQDSWMIPQVGDDKVSLRKDCVMLSLAREDFWDVCILGLIGRKNDTMTWIQAGDDGDIWLVTRNDSQEERTHSAVISVGVALFFAAEEAFSQARELLGGYDAVEAEQVLKPANDAKSTTLGMHKWYDDLGFCTWNSIGRELTVDKIIEALQSLKKAGIKVNFLIIDDNWQSLIDRKWDEFEADPKAFPQGLLAGLNDIWQAYGWDLQIFVWHSIFGYWEGIAPGGWVDRNFKCIETTWKGGNKILIVDPSDVNRLYSKFYKFLADSGVSGVKCDVQSSLIQLDDPQLRTSVSESYQAALRLQSTIHFGRNVIYCMSQQPTNMLRSLLPTHLPEAVIRNSDDYFPNVPESHIWHIYTNICNSLYTTRLNAIPDWDMFQTTLPMHAETHAIARAISGGPVYITDSPNTNHDVRLINLVSALSPRLDQRIVMRTEKASTGYPYIKFGAKDILVFSSMWNPAYAAVLGLLNTSTVDVDSVINLRDLSHQLKKTRGKEHHRPLLLTLGVSSRRITQSLPQGATSSILYHPNRDDNPLLTLTIPPQSIQTSYITTVFPVPNHPLDPEVSFFGVNGLHNLVCPSAAITSLQPSLSQTRSTLHVELRGLGILEIWIQTLSSRVDGEFEKGMEGKVKGVMVSLLGRPVEGKRVSWIKSRNLVLVDLEAELRDRKEVVTGEAVPVGVSVWVPGLEEE